MTKLFLFILFLNAFLIFGLAIEPKTLVVEERQHHDMSVENKTTKPHSDKSENVPVQGENKDHHFQGKPKIKSQIIQQATPVNQLRLKENVSSEHNETIAKDSNKLIPSYNGPSTMEKESEIVTKGSMVLISVSLLFIVFVAFKTYRRKSRSARIKKYGIRLARGNIEMTPLPLDNDDDDETIFDLKNVPT
ncbi:membrane protein FAM174-like [Coccinella septempunctata]|uniref:membrane protein FAM174-like n=1 Tax=Coccinella septempunctata TaxID=41139 RepID=UPI001D08FABA|nr:membrane protein FAM174-like [Coccinella septempunctata]